MSRNLITELKRWQKNDPESFYCDAAATHYPPLKLEQIPEIEQRLGCKLPSTLVQVYTQIANGGFGGEYGYLGLLGGFKDSEKMDAISFYEHLREGVEIDQNWVWPQALLPLQSLGCGMYLCVDCTTPEGKIIWFEPNAYSDGDPLENCLFPFIESLEALLLAWIDDIDLWEQYQ